MEQCFTHFKYPILFLENKYECKKIIEPHWHNDIEIIYILFGKLETYIDGQKKRYEQGDMFIINSGCIHDFLFLESTHIYTYYLSTIVLQEFDISVHKSLMIKEELSHSSWIDDFIALKEISHMSNLQKHIHMYHLYDKLIQDCQYTPLQDQNVIEKITTYLKCHYNQDITLHKLADEFHFHPHYLTRLFKNQVHLSYYQYLQKVRLEHAYQDLIHTQLSIQEIALKHGFKNVKSYEVLFQRIYHEKPSVYRKKVKEHNTFYAASGRIKNV